MANWIKTSKSTAVNCRMIVRVEQLAGGYVRATFADGTTETLKGSDAVDVLTELAQDNVELEGPPPAPPGPGVRIINTEPPDRPDDEDDRNYPRPRA